MNAVNTESSGVTNLATTTADVLSLKLYHLIGTVKLAAFAAEARRALNAIESIASTNPAISQRIQDSVTAFSGWSEIEDNLGEVLQNVASQLEDVSCDFSETVYDLARAKKGGAL